MTSRRSTSLTAKLSGVIGLLALAIVGSVSGTLTALRQRELTAELHQKAALYARLLASQLEPAVAFDDDQTAREVLNSVSIDLDVERIGLYGAEGQLIEASPQEPPPWPDAVVAPVTRAAGGFIEAAAPVRSREGPVGTLLISISTRRLDAHARNATLVSVSVAAVVLGIALLAAWLIASTLTGRVRRIAAVADRVSSGDLAVEHLEAGPGDEVGRLTAGFNVMVVRLRELVQQARLEGERAQERKLESVGRLASGLAHEMNTPVQFIGDSVTFMRDAWRDVGTLLAAQRRLLDGKLSPEEAETLAALEESADLAYLEEQVPQSAEMAVAGLARVARLVSSLKMFAHADQRERINFDVNQGIESTLVVARDEYQAVADVKVELSPGVFVSCCPGQLNQVLLNLIVNAAHAVGDVSQASGRKGLITVSSRLDAGRARIEVTDNGTGIPHALHPRVFEQFFTTKPLGKGAGQGLAMSRSIVQRYGGQVSFESQEGRGSTFVVDLPAVAAPGRAA